ncbi:MAG TPA: anthranilate phosphoribosyltransferase [Solirubrobacterales bacterium]|jgi:anthranilate phosphoribosyltransferase|nr:anthranilate phosphoribosyltransferase [Solirubrobacterales bacterium]
MPNEILTRAIDAVCSGEHLTSDHASAVLAEIMEGRAGDVQTGAFLVALRAKGETVPELIGLARTMRGLATHVETGRHDLVDTAGTGGGPSTFNVSTTAALIAAGAGCAVAKHGNRSSTSRSGSADMLEALGVEIALQPEQVGEAIRTTGFGFMFAPAHHAAMKHVVPVRAELAVRTIFNFLGPLTNPAGATRQLLGVSDRRYQETIAEALAGLDCEHAMVVTAEEGLDELSISGPTRVIEVREGGTSEWFVDPGDYGIDEAPLEAIAGGEPADNAATARAILAGEPGPAADIALLNAGAAIYVGGGAGDLAGGIEAAHAAIDSGAAAGVLRRLVAMRGSDQDVRSPGVGPRDR